MDINKALDELRAHLVEHPRTHKAGCYWRKPKPKCSSPIKRVTRTIMCCS
jgi:hypothetical protein